MKYKVLAWTLWLGGLIAFMGVLDANMGLSGLEHFIMLTGFISCFLGWGLLRKLEGSQEPF